jgi:hypothetical protein
MDGRTQAQRSVRTDGADDVRVQLFGQALPLTLRIEDAAKLVGVGRSSMYAAVKRGEFSTMRINGRTVVLTVPLLRLMGLEVNSAGLLDDLGRTSTDGDAS